MANPNRRTNSYHNDTGRSNRTTNGPTNGLPPLDTGRGHTNEFQPVGTEQLADYTNQLAHLEAQNRLRQQIARDEQRQAQSQPQSPIGPPAPRWNQYEPQTAVDSTYWNRADPELSSPSTITSGSQSAQSANESIYEYQQMLLVEQQRRIREMEETRRQQERQRQREQHGRRQ